MLSPLILQVFVSLAFLLYFYIKKFISKKKVEISFYFKTMFISFIVICDTQYTQILIAFLKMFDCIQIDSANANTYLKFAPHIQCYSHDHIYYSLQ